MGKRKDLSEMDADEIAKFFAETGMEGGRATGKAKVRGDAEYYRSISQKAAKARKAKRAKK
jgi:hypothetical protein